MGNQIQQNLYQQPPTTPQQLYIISQYEEGQIIESNKTNQQYLMRQLSFTSQQTLQQTMSLLQHYQQNQQCSNMLINLLNIQEKKIKNICGSVFRINLIFQFSSLSIYNQIQARKQYNNYFDILDCYRIVIGCIKGIIQSQKQYKQYPTLTKNQIINRVFIHPDRILLMSQGFIKLCSPLIVSPYDRLQHKHNCYYSPEKLMDFDFSEDEKSVIFELGITLIHILTLKSCQDIYNGFEVMQDIIANKIQQIWCLYSDSLLCQILAKMTQTVRHSRLNLTQCGYLVNLAQEKLNEKQHEIQKDIFNFKFTENKFENEGLEVSMGLTQRKIIDYHANNYCVNTYSRYKNNICSQQLNLKSDNKSNKNISTISNCELRLSSLKTQQHKSENPSKIILNEPNQFKYQHEKINQIINRKNSSKQILDDTNKQNYQPLSNAFSNQQTIANNQQKQSLLIYENKKSLFCFKEANVNSDQNTYGNIQQNLKNSLSLVNSISFNDDIGKNKIQQSFQYGHQLTEGIISLFEELQPLPYNTQNSHDIKFERKRTQFLKNTNKYHTHNSKHKCALNLSPLNEQNQLQHNISARKFKRMVSKDREGKTLSQ